SGQQDHYKASGCGTALKLFYELAPVHAGHAVVGDEKVGRIVDGLEQSVGTIGRCADVSQRRERLLEHSQDHGAVIHQQDFDVVGHDLFSTSCVVAAFASGLALQDNLANLDTLVEGLAHVVNGQGGDTRGHQRFHLDTCRRSGLNS